MLDRTSKNLMHVIICEKPNMEDGLFTWDYLSKICGLTRDEVFDCIRFLDGRGLLRCVYVDPPNTGGGKWLWGVAPNHRGRHYQEFARLEFFETILKSVLLPVLVAVIASLVTSLIVAT